MPKLIEILEKIFQISPEKITDSLGQSNFDAWDSMTHLILITELEEAYEIQIEEEDILSMKTVSDIKNVLTKNAVTNF